MAQAFAPVGTGGDGLVGRMEPVEIELVVDAMQQVQALLTEDGAEPADGGEDDFFASLAASMREREAPSDPALRRLLPDGASSDESASREFRRLSEDTIRQQKTGNLATAIAAFSRFVGVDEPTDVVLTRPQARATMMALTDVRLVLAERLELHTDEDAEDLHELVAGLEVPRGERELTAIHYDFITWLSESLTVAYMGRA